MKIRPEWSSFANANGNQEEPDSKRMRYNFNNKPSEYMELDNHRVSQSFNYALNNMLTKVSSDSFAQSDGNSTLKQSGQRAQNTNIRFLVWNIEEFSNKLEDHELMSYLSSYDIFGLLETWECSSDQFVNMFPSHHCQFLSALKRSNVGRAMSGVIGYAKTYLLKYVKRLGIDRV